MGVGTLNNTKMILKKKKKKKKGTKTAFSFKAMANKNRTLLTPGNIHTPKSLWYETNRKSRLSPNKSYKHTRTPEGSRKERNKQEGEENPQRHLLQNV